MTRWRGDMSEADEGRGEVERLDGTRPRDARTLHDAPALLALLERFAGVRLWVVASPSTGSAARQTSRAKLPPLALRSASPAPSARTRREVGCSDCAARPASTRARC